MTITAECMQNELECEQSEWAIRVDLAAAYQLVSHYGWDDLIFTHISARVPGSDDHFLINPYGLMFNEITASSLVKVDLNGYPVAGDSKQINPAGFTIHGAIHRARHDAQCVLHLHSLDGTSVASHAEGLLALNQTSLLLREDLSYHDYEGVAFDADEGPRLIRDLGKKNLMLLRNHGTLSLGESVATAFLRMYFLERACSMQVRTLASGPRFLPSQQAVEKVARQSKSGMVETAEQLVWPALIRQVQQFAPGFDQ